VELPTPKVTLLPFLGFRPLAAGAAAAIRVQVDRAVTAAPAVEPVALQASRVDNRLLVKVARVVWVGATRLSSGFPVAAAAARVVHLQTVVMPTQTQVAVRAAQTALPEPRSPTLLAVPEQQVQTLARVTALAQRTAGKVVAVKAVGVA
jgi:hypothetical protein